ncbi:lycopene cyclase domain-containing protein [Microbacterium paraoxydans]|jgi:lycopene cyclase domain-containing protein|uniref:Lycopene cyclase domain-containing protein n=1 Tax=Microbacterium paraoxydans TaxID=199592 RepID=A0A1H1PLJ5_9MICO|nr:MULTISPECIES: lycopene cyclase domain-containing protein [Microbacterium]AVL97828.1 lycopene cyclase domain-containing protein [Microbacterium sp. str. 'China']SDS11974.1 lycopene cyclase domain-containing protein [Microbacterium paraoxydans]
MTYLQLSAVFLAVAALAAVALGVAARRTPHLGALALTALALLVLTAVFDTVMIATGLFHYAPGPLAGLHIGLAPIEDFAYPLAGVLLLPALWTALRGRRSRTRAAARMEEQA